MRKYVILFLLFVSVIISNLSGKEIDISDGLNTHTCKVTVYEDRVVIVFENGKRLELIGK